MEPKEIAERIVTCAPTGFATEFEVLAKAYLSQADKIQGLVDCLKKIRDDRTLDFRQMRVIASMTLTAYKEGKHDGD